MASSSNNISGLREQIIGKPAFLGLEKVTAPDRPPIYTAIAARAYQDEVNDHLSRTKTNIIKPAEIFDVVLTPEVVIPDTRFQAALVPLTPNSDEVLSVGLGDTIEEAYMELLMAVGRIAAHEMKEVDEKLSPAAATANLSACARGFRRTGFNRYHGSFNSRGRKCFGGQAINCMLNTLIVPKDQLSPCLKTIPCSCFSC